MIECNSNGLSTLRPSDKNRPSNLAFGMFFFVLKHLSALVIFPLDLPKHCLVVFHDGVRCRGHLSLNSDSDCTHKTLLQVLEEEEEWIKLGRSLRV